MNLTQHFTLEEMERSQTALSLGIANYATYEAKLNLQNLCQKVLEPLRLWWGGPIIVNSGYRSPELNQAVGGVSCSQHLKGEAADIAPLSSPLSGRKPASQFESLRLLFAYIRESLPYDQLILEHDQKGNRWIHVSLRRDPTKNRKQAITGLLKR